ncbi:hypothetical protein NDU88_002727 [Pleurodeles waltl]|uniref:Uncharacterized protein n=1 Tax=Pleurodeles waltl TaxID=8319 RepID=A0AAV7VBD6_PLEWA|nr:hypothetical protein NDU88_002727 [Pleurodeles waltl]
MIVCQSTRARDSESVNVTVREADPEKECTGGTTDRSDADPEEAGAAGERICMNDSEPLGVLNPEWEEVERESRFPQEERRRGRKMKRREEY